MRARATTIVVAVLAALLLAPAAALAQGDPFGPLPSAPQPAPEPVTTPGTPTGDGGSLDTTESLLIAAAALVLIAGIATAILRDARNAAPAAGRDPVVDRDGLDRERPKGSKAPPQRRAKQSRQRAKVARQSRKRNRPA